jgi:phytoene dehydrogenase-like protein
VNGADAVIIGAGHNGLVAANLLADEGWDVQVIEAAPQPGGAVRSGEITAPGYLSDLFSSFYPLSYASPVMNHLRITDHGVTWTHSPDVVAHLLPDGRAAVLNRDPLRTAESLEQFAPGDGEKWHHAYDDWREVSQHMLGVLFSGFPPVRAGLGLARQLKVGGSLRLARRLVLSARELTGELFDGEGARLLMTGCALHTDLSPEEAGGGVYGWLLAMLGQEYGWPVPVGGAQKLTDALVTRLEAKGGRIAYGSAVERVLIARGRAMGVRTADGRDWRARRAVLADVPAPALFLDLVGGRHLPPRFVEDLAHFRWDGSTVKVDWALSAPIPWKNPAAAGAGTVHLGADLNGLTHYSAALASGEVPEQPFMLLGQNTVADPSRSPAGTESMWAYTHLPHRQDWEPDVIAAHVERMQGVIEEAAPGFGRLVVGRHVYSPADMQAENPSLVGGAVGGGTAAAFQQLFLRPIPGLGRPDTPVDRLYLASSSAHPGGGVHGAPGANAARAALTRHNRVAGGLYRGVVDAAHRAIYR